MTTKYTPSDLIVKFYGAKKARRSGIPLIAHITDGNRIIVNNYKRVRGSLNSSKEVLCDAFSLHPLLQDPKDLHDNLHMVLKTVGNSHLEAVTLAVEYRNLANSYLCKPSTDVYTKDSLRRLLEFYSVDASLLLYADKAQNRSDFHLFHYGYHDRSEKLKKYFDTWVEVLSEKLFN